jgi:hypothetical protein
MLPVEKISNVEMMERRKKGGGGGNAKWSRGHFCASARLFLIEGVEEKVTNLEEVEPDLGEFFFWKNFLKFPYMLLLELILLRL